MKSPDELTRLFREQGRKATPQRQAVFRVLHGHTGHPSAESVYEQVSVEMPTISLRTVYQTLNDLVQMGEIVQIDLGTGSARFDPNLTSHQHLVCDGCGRVLDVAGDLTDFPVPPAHAEGFRITRTEIVFRGSCADCQADEALAR